ncbi:MAG TPA: hypoxanthine phosphoribosyltransferase [Bdellovibrionales bacterium]|nr:hypoxanthine phosphoribosyltransferase [Bdellovibrionales bacterium]
MERLKLSTLISEDQIAKRVKEMGAEITKRFKGEELVTVCVLRGAFMFYADLIRSIDTDVSCEFFGCSSYKSTKSTGEVKLTLDLTQPIEGKNVLLVEDIVDTGLTMSYLLKTLKARNPKTLLTAALLFKPEALKTKVDIDFVGFEIAKDYVVGYGLDFEDYYRNLPYVGKVENIN